MPAEITMPQLSDTMTEGTVVKWLKKEGEAVKSGEIIAEIETDKATMETEAFDSGVMAVIAVPAGAKANVGAIIGVIATGKEDPAQIKKQFGDGPKAKALSPTASPAAPSAAPSVAKAAPPAPAASPVAPTKTAPPAKVDPSKYQFDIVVIGGGPAGYAAAIRAGQLKQRVLCVEKAELGGTCLNWGCIPTKALLEDGAFIRKLRTEAAERGVSFSNLQIDFSKIVARSRGIAEKLSRGIAHLFKKNNVKHEVGVGSLVGPNRVKITGKTGSTEVTAAHIIIAVGAKPVQLPGMEFDGKKIITSREAMNLPSQPKKIAIIGAGAIGCEFADFYNAVGTEVVLIEMLEQLLPIEDEDVSKLLERIMTKKGIDVRLKTKTEKAEKTDTSVKLTLSGDKPGTVEADVVLVAVGVAGNTAALGAEAAKLELFKGRVKVTPEYQTNLPGVWAVGDCVSLHWPAESSMGGYRHPDLAHVAHHEAVALVEHIVGISNHTIDYTQIPGCTYTHPQVASMGMTEKKCKEQKREVRIGKFPFSASGRALAAGESDGFVKLIFDAKYGELLGVHMIGESVTELLAELVLARKLEATEEEILEAMHPHPTLSEAVMEAAGAAEGKAIHI